MLKNIRRKSVANKAYSCLYPVISFDQVGGVYCTTWEMWSNKQALSRLKAEKSFSKSRFLSFLMFEGHYNTLEMNMIYCPKGTFTMGLTGQKDKPPRTEMIEAPFLLGESEVTQELYEAVMRCNPSEFKSVKNGPVENVSWFDAIEFCNSLSGLQGLEKCYTISDRSSKDRYGVDQNRTMSAKVLWNETANGYRLPEEKEWEYAAKAGTQNRWSGTDIKRELGDCAWFYQNTTTHLSTRTVKTRAPNDWGFYDMSGNVWEWCWDRTSTDNVYSVLRGGSWYTDSLDLQVSYRLIKARGELHSTAGFRICRSLVQL